MDAAGVAATGTSKDGHDDLQGVGTQPASSGAAFGDEVGDAENETRAEVKGNQDVDVATSDLGAAKDEVMKPSCHALCTPSSPRRSCSAR